MAAELLEARFPDNEVRRGLTEAREAVTLAEGIGNHRAEMVARLTATRNLCELGELDEATSHVERGLEIAESLGADRFPDKPV